MSKIAVIYKSKHGTTKQYAEWIGAALNASVFDVSEVKPSQLMLYDMVIYGGGLYAGGIAGVKLVAKNPCKALVIFTVGLADPTTTNYSDILQKNFTVEMLSATKIFHLRGGVDYSKLGLIDKGLMAMLKSMTLKKDESELLDEDKLFLETYGGKLNFVNKDSIAPIIAYVDECLMLVKIKNKALG